MAMIFNVLFNFISFTKQFNVTCGILMFQTICTQCNPTFMDVIQNFLRIQALLNNSRCKMVLLLDLSAKFSNDIVSKIENKFETWSRPLFLMKVKERCISDNKALMIIDLATDSPICIIFRHHIFTMRWLRKEDQRH